MSNYIYHDRRRMTVDETSDKPWTFQKLERELVIRECKKQNITLVPSTVQLLEDDAVKTSTLSFQIEGCDPVFVNTLRRTVISEVPVVAIEKVYISHNTGVMADDSLAHRLGLLPLRFNANLLEYPTHSTINWFPSVEGEIWEDTSVVSTEQWLGNCNLPNNEALLFELKVEPSKHASQPARYDVCGESLRWLPLPGQREKFGLSQYPSVAHCRVPIVRVNRDQEIYCLCVAVKGIGRDHNKFSPVCPVTYSFMGQLQLKKSIEGKLAEKLQKMLPEGMVEIDPNTGCAKINEPDGGTLPTSVRAILRDTELSPYLTFVSHLERQFFSVESVGQYTEPYLIVREAFNALRRKCQHYEQLFEKEENVLEIVPESSPLHTTGMIDVSKISTVSLNGRICGVKIFLIIPSPTDGVSLPSVSVAKSTCSHLTAIFIGEDHTLGASLVHILSNKIKEVAYASLSKPHPLENKLHLLLETKKNQSALYNLLDSMRTLLKVVENMSDKFEAFLSMSLNK